MEVLDWKYYIQRYPDLKNAGINTKRRAIAHWHKSGKYEHRYPTKRHELIAERKKNNSSISNDRELFNIDESSFKDNLHSELSSMDIKSYLIS